MQSSIQSVIQKNLRRFHVQKNLKKETKKNQFLDLDKEIMNFPLL